MCGRYYVDGETAREVAHIVKNTGAQATKMRTGDIYPSHTAVVVNGSTAALKLEEMQWGFPQYKKKGLLINARAETALERKAFCASLLHRRCVIPAKHFYEWDPDKNKAIFYREGRPVVYMAGFYNCFSDQPRFMVLTTQANASVRPVHHRMPLILEEAELEDWVFDHHFMEYALSRTPPMLNREQEYEQQRLFL